MERTVFLIKKIFESFCEEDSRRLGIAIGESARKGYIYTLNGDLGAGKTLIAGAVANGLSIYEPISSPTFTILKTYGGGRLPFYHFDVYRINDIYEMDEIGYGDYFFGGGVCLIEWADLIQDLLPDNVNNIYIERNLSISPDYRKIVLTFNYEDDKISELK